MKNIVAIILAFLFTTGSVLLGMFLSDSYKDVSVVKNQSVYEPLGVQLRNDKTQSLPLDKCNSEKEVEGAHVQNARVVSVRKIFSRFACFAPVSFLNKHLVIVRKMTNKAQPNKIAYALNNLPLHIRYCIWLI